MSQSQTLTAQQTTKKLPTPIEMMAFAKPYTKDQWDKLCRNRDFLAVFTEDLIQAKKIAEVTLKGP